MNPLSQMSNADPLVEEIRRLSACGYSLLPLGGEDGKKPQLPYKGVKKIPTSQVLALLRAKGSKTYGIRLPNMVVVDCDKSSSELIEAMKDRFGDSPVQVKTPRGLHLYYKFAGHQIPKLKQGFPVDIKSGPNSFVVGPGSIRPNGEEYIALCGQLGVTKLPIFVDSKKNAPNAEPIALQLVPKGKRHVAIRGHGLKLLGQVRTENEMVQLLLDYRNAKCRDPSTVYDIEVSKLANWCWELRANNSIFSGQNSTFSLWRNEHDALNGNADAIALFTVIQRNHGHLLGKTFPLIHESMKSAGIIDLSRDRFLAARKYLIQTGLLNKASNHQAGIQHRHYRLLRLIEY